MMCITLVVSVSFYFLSTKNEVFIDICRDIIKEIKKHSFYLKPGEKRRVKAALARKRARKKARHEQD